MSTIFPKTRPLPLFTLVAIVVVLLCGAGPVVAQGNASRPDAPTGKSEIGTIDRGVPAIVMIGNRPVAVYRSSIFGYSPQERARSTTERIRAILVKGPTGSVRTQQRTEGTAILIGDEIALIITPDDLDKVAGETMDEAVNRAVQELDYAVKEWRELRNPRVLVRSGLTAALETIVFILVVFIVRRGGRLPIKAIDLLKKRFGETFALATFNPIEHAITVLLGTVKFIIWALLAIATYVWLAFVLSLFPYTRPWGENLGTYAFSFIRSFGIAVISSIPGILTVVVIFVLMRFLIRLVRNFFNSVQERKITVGWVHPVTARPTSDIISVLLWLLAFILAYRYLPGSSSEAFRGVSIFAGLIVSLGSASVFGQVMAGLTLMYSRAFQPGDYVLAGENEGVVLSLGYLSTKILTPRGEEIHIPNSVLLSTATKNYSRTEGGKGIPLFVRVGIGYSAPWRQIYQLLLDAAKQTKGVQAEPAPRVYQLELGDFYVTYELVVFMDVTMLRHTILSALHENIQDTFNRAGVQIMSPHYESDPAEKVWVPPHKWEPNVRGEQLSDSAKGCSTPDRDVQDESV